MTKFQQLSAPRTGKQLRSLAATFVGNYPGGGARTWDPRGSSGGTREAVGTRETGSRETGTREAVGTRETGSRSRTRRWTDPWEPLQRIRVPGINNSISIFRTGRVNTRTSSVHTKIFSGLKK